MHRRFSRWATLALAPLALGAALDAAPAFADDSVGPPTDRQLLKDCIERQKTATATVSTAQAKRLCKDELKRQKQTGATPEPPPVDAPRSPDDTPPPDPPPG
jgi:hypothetical protein